MSPEQAEIFAQHLDSLNEHIETLRKRAYNDPDFHPQALLFGYAELNDEDSLRCTIEATGTDIQEVATAGIIASYMQDLTESEAIKFLETLADMHSKHQQTHKNSSVH